MLQNRNDCIVTIKRGDEIGGFRPQCVKMETRHELASVEGTLLATALGIGILLRIRYPVALASPLLPLWAGRDTSVADPVSGRKLG